MKKEDTISIRKFVNGYGYHTLGSIGVFADPPNSWGITAYILVQDCTRVVTLDLDISDWDDLDNAMLKIDTMIEVLTDGRKQLKKFAKKNLPDIIEHNKKGKKKKYE